MQFRFNGVYYYVANNSLIEAAAILITLGLIAVGTYLQRPKAKTMATCNRFGTENESALPMLPSPVPASWNATDCRTPSPLAQVA